ncbi:hypothetical protein TNCV_2194241 [Trichonephila clavipes]|uniref:Uncharacterized protein n=1 Tax=Trichonephila clavipes TaxID=2585209 RepID=A0A8X6SFP4_TRICX|nr:hypothetical protein TNCV_2194241 [Trichonephila clavipes]
MATGSYLTPIYSRSQTMRLLFASILLLVLLMVLCSAEDNPKTSDELGKNFMVLISAKDNPKTSVEPGKDDTKTSDEPGKDDTKTSDEPGNEGAKTSDESVCDSNESDGP